MFSCFVLIDPPKTGLNSIIWSAWRKEEEIGNWRTCRNKCTNNIPKKKEYRILEKHCEVKFEIGANISEGRAT